MAIGLFVHPDDPRDWVGELHAVLPKEEIRRWPDLGDRADIEIALVGKPEPGALQGLSRLRLIHCLWAGVDQLLSTGQRCLVSAMIRANVSFDQVGEPSSLRAWMWTIAAPAS